jgi:hypothetical protein
MLRFLRLPCALLALLLSALGGPRFAVDRGEDGDPDGPVIAALVAPLAAQAVADPLDQAWHPAPRLSLPAGSGHGGAAGVAPRRASALRPAPGPRRGSAGGPRAP